MIARVIYFLKKVTGTILNKRLTDQLKPVSNQH